MKTLKMNLNYLVLLLMIIVTSSFTSGSKKNPFKNQTFRVDGIAFEKKERDKYIFTPYEKKSNSFYGYFIDFKDSSFHCYNREECGNDCFTEVKGLYTVVSDSTINIYVNSITKSGKCYMDKEYYKGAYGTFVVRKDNNSINLIRKQ